jgi:sphingomyelin phosphodiesterase
MYVSFALDRWSREYNRLVYRFRNTIIGQFFGHTHFDEFELFFAPRTSANDIKEVTNVAYLAPSQTPHDGLNPAYRIYTIDGEKWIYKQKRINISQFLPQDQCF